MPTIERNDHDNTRPSFEQQAAQSDTADNLSSQERWEQKTLEKLLFASLTEQRRQRRWGIFFKSLFFAYLAFTAWIIWPSKPIGPSINKPHVALIDIKGLILEDQLGADDITASLRKAFSNANVQHILLRISSGGGSAVQADYIYNEIDRLKAAYPTKTVYAVCTEACASAAYLIATASHYIYANPMSLVGSLSTRISSFGFVEIMEKLGIERRFFASGKYKSMLDPFSPLPENIKQMMQEMLDSAHDIFIQKIIASRGGRIDPTNEELFSGRFWIGMQAYELGLVDGFASAGEVARDIIGNENIINYTIQPTYFDLFTKRLGSWSTQLSSWLNALQHP